MVPFILQTPTGGRKNENFTQKNHEKEKDKYEDMMLKRKDDNVVEGKAGNFFPARPLRFL